MIINDDYHFLQWINDDYHFYNRVWFRNNKTNNIIFNKIVLNLRFLKPKNHLYNCILTLCALNILKYDKKKNHFDLPVTTTNLLECHVQDKYALK